MALAQGRFTTERWRWGVRLLATANLILVSVGVWRMVRDSFCDLAVIQSATASYGMESELPYEVPIFYMMLVVNGFCLVGLLAGCLYAWRENPWGLRIWGSTFAIECGYWTAQILFKFAAVRWGGENAALLRSSFAAVSGAGDIGLAPQFALGYPIIGLIATMLLQYLRVEKLRPSRIG